jgi:hypothetical protein
MPYEMRALDVKSSRSGQFVSLAIQNHAILESLPDHFFEHPNQRDDQAELCQLKKFCVSSEQDHVFRQFTAGNDML